MGRGRTAAEIQSTTEESAASFGTLQRPCGPGTARINAAESVAGTDKLYIGVANDRSGNIVRGALAELWESSKAFTKWCNRQGGLAGLHIELVDLDAQLFEAGKQHDRACLETFTMVGGGFIVDEFEGANRSSIDCSMVEFPEIVVSTARYTSDRLVSAVPNPPFMRTTSGAKQLARMQPTALSKVEFVYLDLESTRSDHELALPVAAALPEPPVVTSLLYSPSGSTDWSEKAK
ncbi:MAG TPA: hypothetical protein DEG43_04765 [Acidimicrobiaceae bacterium]|nr:hypothetical protein [Acidimicrobiaceae bacterium]